MGALFVWGERMATTIPGRVCSRCVGSGHASQARPCAACQGTGWIASKRELSRAQLQALTHPRPARP